MRFQVLQDIVVAPPRIAEQFCYQFPTLWKTSIPLTFSPGPALTLSSDPVGARDVMTAVLQASLALICHLKTKPLSYFDGMANVRHQILQLISTDTNTMPIKLCIPSFKKKNVFQGLFSFNGTKLPVWSLDESTNHGTQKGGRKFYTLKRKNVTLTRRFHLRSLLHVSVKRAPPWPYGLRGSHQRNNGACCKPDQNFGAGLGQNYLRDGRFWVRLRLLWCIW